MSLIFTLPRVSPDPLPTSTVQPNQSFHQPTAVFPTRGGARPSAVRDFPPNCGPSSSITASPVAGNEDSMSELKEYDADEHFEGFSSSPERDEADEFYDDMIHSLRRGDLDVDESYDDMMRSLRRGDLAVDESYDDMMRSLRRGDLAVDESYDEDLISTGDADEHFEGSSSSSERDDAELIYDDMMRSLRRGDFAEEDSMSTGARDDDDGYEEDSIATQQSDEGLPEEVIASFLKTMTTCDRKLAAAVDGGVCAVCLDDLYEEDRAVGVLGCQHGFHGDCIGDWLRKKNDCPLCRAIAVKI